MNNEVCEAAMGEGHEQWGSNFETENYQYCLMSHLENLDDIVMIHILNSIIWHPPPSRKIVPVQWTFIYLTNYC